MLLNARLHNYGFVLAMPATIVTLVALLGWVAAWIDGPVEPGRRCGAPLWRRRQFHFRVTAWRFEDLRARARPDQTLAHVPERE